MVKALHYQSEGPGIDSQSPGFFPGHQTVPCALGSTQPLKMSTRIFLGETRPVRKGDDLTTFMFRVSRNSGALTYQKPQRPLGV